MGEEDLLGFPPKWGIPRSRLMKRQKAGRMITWLAELFGTSENRSALFFLS